MTNGITDSQKDKLKQLCSQLSLSYDERVYSKLSSDLAYEIIGQMIDEVNVKKSKEVNQFIKKRGSIFRWNEFIVPRFPLILFPGGEVREKDYNSWARRENKTPLCKIFKYDIAK